MWPNADPTPLPHSGIFKTCPTWQLTSQSHDCLEPTKRPSGNEKINVSSRYIVSAGQKIIVKNFCHWKQHLATIFYTFGIVKRKSKEWGAMNLEKSGVHQPVTAEVPSPRLKWSMFTSYRKPSLISWVLRRKSALWKPGLEDSCLSDTLGLLLSLFFLGLQTHIIENYLWRTLLGLWFHPKSFIGGGIVHPWGYFYYTE